MKKNFLIALIIAMMVLLFLGGQWAYGAGHINVQTLKTHKDFLRSLVTYNQYLAAAVYTLIYVLSVVAMLPLGAPLALAGGFLFGMVRGMVLINVSTVLGVMLLVMALRHIFRDGLPAKYKNSMKLVNTMLERHGVLYLVCVRVLFVIPSFLINSILAFTDVPLYTILWTTSVGIIPVSLLFCSAGSELEKINAIGDLVTWRVGVIFGALAVMTLLPIVLKKYVGHLFVAPKKGS
jgi:uncharacterized membrane protein YdjX (TVP38/TMEM64 family)